jgi:hypothetical protein
MLRFVTRYSAFIYGTDLQPIIDPETVLKVETTPGGAGVWWHNYCYNYVHNGSKKVVVHLLGSPQNDRIFENKTGEVRKVKTCRVTYNGPEKVVKAYELSPFVEGERRELTVDGQSVKTSDFYLWDMVVLELGN